MMEAVAFSNLRQERAEEFVVAAVHDRAARNGYYRCKQVVDIAIAAALLIALLPLFVLIVLAIKLDSPGPVFYRQLRIGARRRRQGENVFWRAQQFRVYKFRSMHCGADESVHRAYIELYCQGKPPVQNSGGAHFKLSNDSRITRVGRLLRRSSLDELPQLINVLIGDMSICGPRPVPVYEVAQYQRWHFDRFTAPSGLTGWWQVKGRGRVTFEEMIRMDIEYARLASFWLDVKILWLTIPAVLSARGAR